MVHWAVGGKDKKTKGKREANLVAPVVRTSARQSERCGSVRERSQPPTAEEEAAGGGQAGEKGPSGGARERGTHAQPGQPVSISLSPSAQLAAQSRPLSFCDCSAACAACAAAPSPWLNFFAPARRDSTLRPSLALAPSRASCERTRPNTGWLVRGWVMSWSRIRVRAAQHRQHRGMAVRAPGEGASHLDSMPSVAIRFAARDRSEAMETNPFILLTRSTIES